MNLFLIWICCVCFAHPCWSQTIEDARALTTDLLENYSRILRPKRNQSDAVRVRMVFELLSIQEFDEVQERLSVTAVFALNWTDEMMTWDPKDYGGIDNVRFESDQVWTPMIVLINSVEKLEKLGFEDSWLLVSYTHNGSATFYPGGVLSSKCDVDVAYFPWDKHKCELKFTTWGYSPDDVHIIPIQNEVSRNFYTPNGAWNYISSEIQFEDFYLFNIYIVLGRKSRFMLVNIISPIMLMALVSVVVFLIPVESGERISFSITMLLAVAVFLTLVGDNLPKTSNPMSIFSYYLLSVLVLNIFITLANIFSLRIYYLDAKKPIGSCWLSFTKQMMRKRRNAEGKEYRVNSSESTDGDLRKHAMNAQAYYVVADSPRANIDGGPATYSYHLEEHRSKPRDIHGFHSNRISHVTKSKHSPDTEGKQSDEIITWRDVSIAVDKVSFVMTLLLTIFLTIIMFMVIWINGSADV